MIDHYENPRNVGSLDKNDFSVGTAVVGAPACGDVMKLQIKVCARTTLTNERSGCVRKLLVSAAEMQNGGAERGAEREARAGRGQGSESGAWKGARKWLD